MQKLSWDACAKKLYSLQYYTSAGFQRVCTNKLQRNQVCTHEIMRSKTRSFTCDPNIETSSLHKNYRTHQASDFHQCLNFPSLVHHPVMKCRACSCVTASSSDEVRKITKKTNSFTTSKLQSVRQVCSP